MEEVFCFGKVVKVFQKVSTCFACCPVRQCAFRRDFPDLEIGLEPLPWKTFSFRIPLSVLSIVKSAHSNKFLFS